MKPKAFSHIYIIEEDNLKDSVVEITTEIFTVKTQLTTHVNKNYSMLS